MFSAFGPNVTILQYKLYCNENITGSQPHYRGVTMVTTSNYYNE